MINLKEEEFLSLREEMYLEGNFLMDKNLGRALKCLRTETNISVNLAKITLKARVILN